MFLTALAAIGLLLGTPAQQGAAFAATKLTMPACEAGLNAWAATVNPAETYNVAPSLPLPRALDDDAVVPVFGTGVLWWTAEDVKAVSAALVACYQAAGKHRDVQTMNALKAANVAVAGNLGKTVAWLERVRSEVQKQQAAIAALPDSIELEKALGELIEADPAKPDLEGTRGLPQAINAPVWAIAKVMPSLPDAEREALMVSLGERRAALQAGSAGDIGTVVAAAEATADGVIAIMAMPQTAKHSPSGKTCTGSTGVAARAGARHTRRSRHCSHSPWRRPPSRRRPTTRCSSAHRRRG